MYQRFGKRTLDVLLAAFLIVPLTPVLGAIAVAIMLTSRGPVLFHQKRQGRDWRGTPTVFRIVKFRTMVAGAALQVRAVEHLFASPTHGQAPAGQDPRVTRVGTFLRDTGLDELPQLWNILVGKMSLVGPRPKLPRETRQFGETVRRERQGIRPGLTGLDQVSLKSGKTGPEHSITLDLEYVRRVTFAQDARIILQTSFLILRAVFTRWTMVQNDLTEVPPG